MDDLIFVHPIVSFFAFLAVACPISEIIALATAGQLHVWAVDRMTNEALRQKYQRTWTYRASKWISVKIYKDAP